VQRGSRLALRVSAAGPGGSGRAVRFWVDGAAVATYRGVRDLVVSDGVQGGGVREIGLVAGVTLSGNARVRLVQPEATELEILPDVDFERPGDIRRATQLTS
jgi:hypothetical protein